MRQQATSAYEMLEQRFGISVRLVGATMFLTMRLAWMATILFATSDKVLAPMLGLGPHATVLASVVMCVTTLIYTAEGGLRAVVLTDAVQSLIMLGGAVVVARRRWILATAEVIFRVTNSKPRRGDSWLKRIPAQANMPWFCR